MIGTFYEEQWLQYVASSFGDTILGDDNLCSNSPLKTDIQIVAGKPSF